MCTPLLSDSSTSRAKVQHGSLEVMSENKQPEWEQMLRELLGDAAADELLASMRAQGIDPTQMSGAVIPTDPAQMQQMMSQFKYFMSTDSGPVNWKMAHEIARQKAWGEGDPQINSAQGEQVRQSLQIADLWLDAVTTVEPTKSERHAWRRSDWLDESLETLKQMVEPVASNLANALTQTLHDQMDQMSNAGMADLPEGLASLMGQAGPMIEKMSAAVFGSQVGKALGELSHAALGATDVGVPGRSGCTALVVPNVDAFADEFDIPTDEVRQFLALREDAHARLFASVPWLRVEILGAVRKYASEITIDEEAMRDAAMSVNPTNPDELEIAMSTNLFAGQRSDKQNEALLHLETLLALVEGWVETVTHEAARPYLPHVDQLREIMRRRRIDGSPAEQILGELIGLQMRPRQARNAAILWQHVAEKEGKEARDALWQHPDMAPTAKDLEEPTAFLDRREQRNAEDQEIDDALNQLLEGTLGWAEGLQPGQDSEGDAKQDPHPPSDSDDE